MAKDVGNIVHDADARTAAGREVAETKTVAFSQTPVSFKDLSKLKAVVTKQVTAARRRSRQGGRTR
jgi:stress response protein SCP2